jgi:hypothetical protein
LIWAEGTAEHNGAAAYTTSTEQRINVDQVPQVSAAGRYFWAVVVVDTVTGRRLSPESEARPFTYSGLPSPSEEPAQTAQPPKNTVEPPKNPPSTPGSSGS